MKEEIRSHPFSQVQTCAPRRRTVSTATYSRPVTCNFTLDTCQWHRLLELREEVAKHQA